MFQNPEVRFLSINVCSRDAHKQGALPLMADARETLKVLKTASAKAGLRPSGEYGQEIDRLKKEWKGQLYKEVYRQIPGEIMSQGQLIGVMNEEAQAGDTIVAAAGGPARRSK